MLNEFSWGIFFRLTQHNSFCLLFRLDLDSYPFSTLIISQIGRHLYFKNKFTVWYSSLRKRLAFKKKGILPRKWRVQILPNFHGCWNKPHCICRLCGIYREQLLNLFWFLLSLQGSMACMVLHSIISQSFYQFTWVKEMRVILDCPNLCGFYEIRK